MSVLDGTFCSSLSSSHAEAFVQVKLFVRRKKVEIRLLPSINVIESCCGVYFRNQSSQLQRQVRSVAGGALSKKKTKCAFFCCRQYLEIYFPLTFYVAEPGAGWMSSQHLSPSANNVNSTFSTMEIPLHKWERLLKIFCKITSLFNYQHSKNEVIFGVSSLKKREQTTNFHDSNPSSCHFTGALSFVYKRKVDADV